MKLKAYHKLLNKLKKKTKKKKEKIKPSLRGEEISMIRNER